MPISADQFENISDDETSEPAPGTNAEVVLSFLREHADKAYTQSEIAEETGVKSGSIGPTLVRLRERGRVDHRGQYWRISDHEQSVDAAVYAASDVLRDHEDEPPSFDEWQQHAVDPRDAETDDR